MICHGLDPRLRSVLPPKAYPSHLSLSRSCDRQRRAGWCRPLASLALRQGAALSETAQALCRPAGRPAARVRTRRPSPVWHTHPSRLASDPGLPVRVPFWSGQRRRCAPAHLVAGTGISIIWFAASNRRASCACRHDLSARADGLDAGDSGEGLWFVSHSLDKLWSALGEDPRAGLSAALGQPSLFAFGRQAARLTEPGCAGLSPAGDGKA